MLLANYWHAECGLFQPPRQARVLGAHAELKLVEDQLDQMTAEAEAEYAAEQEQCDEEKPSTEDVDPFQHQKRREAEAAKPSDGD